VEYKRGSPRGDDADALQLCAQAMCLEEMLCCEIPQGALFHKETQHREPVDLTPELRRQVRDLLAEMHDLYARGRTPKVKPTKACGSCSLKELCLPRLQRNGSVDAYLRSRLED
jgi:CRISPR-associated exonuclease Cas4